MQMIYRLIFLLVFVSNECFSDPLIFYNAELPLFVAGEPYGDVRGKLIGQGWRPFLSPDADVCMDGDVRCANRPEVEACSGSGLAPCKFVWNKDGYKLNVFTVGVDATDEGDAAFDGLEIVNSNVDDVQSDVPDIKKDQFIFEARKNLIDSGWKPIETYERTGGKLDRELGSAKPILDAGAIEVGFCSGTGVNYCQFNYQKADACLQVLTGGEYFREDGSPKVIRWTLIDCESLTTKK